MPNKKVIKNKIEFNKLFNNSKQIQSNLYIAKYSISNEFRYGISISKKMFKLAVTRNKIKRQIKSIINSIDIDLNLNMIILIKRNYNINNYSKSKEDFIKLIKKLQSQNQKGV